VALTKRPSVADLKPKKRHWPTFAVATLSIPESKIMHTNVETLITKFAEILDRDPMDQMVDTQAILTRFTEALAVELGEVVVASPFNEGVRMYFDEKIARYEIKKAVGL
jgi:hypothetical protein